MKPDGFAVITTAKAQAQGTGHTESFSLLLSTRDCFAAGIRSRGAETKNQFTELTIYQFNELIV